MAYVGIYNATNTKINSDTYDISFSLENEQGIQPDVRYGIVLEEKIQVKLSICNYQMIL